jgi:hypothetical protein
MIPTPAWLHRNWLKIIGGLIFGALGSGLWEAMMKPGGAWLLNALLSICTFGLHALRDSTYREIALGFHEESSLIVYLVSQIALLVLIVERTSTTVRFARQARSLQQRLEVLEQRIKRGEPPETDTEHPLKGKPFKGRWLVLFAVTNAAVVGWSCVVLLSSIYTNMAISRYEQRLAIASPFLNSQDEKTIRARFASIEGRSDYVAIINTLDDVIASHGKRPTPLLIW